MRAALLFQGVRTLGSNVLAFIARVTADGATLITNIPFVNWNLKRLKGDEGILMIPSAVKPTVLYNQIPDIPPADFTVSRPFPTTYTDENGILQTAPNNVARVDFSEGTGIGSLLIEEEGTNLVTHSLELTPYFQLDSGIVKTLNYGISPDGTNNSTRLVYPSINKGCYKSLIQSESSFSMWVKGVAGETIFIGDYVNTVGELTILTGDWQRVVKIFESTTLQISTRFNSTALDIEVYGVQFEIGSIATSYIKTEGTTVTRPPDQITNGGASQDIDSENGAFIIESKALASTGVTRPILLTDSTGDNRIEISYGLTNIVNVVAHKGGEIITKVSFEVTDVTEFIKVGVRYQVTGLSVWIAGTKVYEDLTFVSYAPNTLSTVRYMDFDGNVFASRVNATRVLKGVVLDSEMIDRTQGTNVVVSQPI
ncbi:MAG: hypothetical protein QM499_00960 [Flavobacteriaceae bacterium]